MKVDNKKPIKRKNAIWTKEKTDTIKANSKMELTELAKLLQVTNLQLLDKMTTMRRNLEI